MKPTRTARQKADAEQTRLCNVINTHRITVAELAQQAGHISPDEDRMVELVDLLEAEIELLRESVQAIRSLEWPEENPREKNDDDGIEYGHPADRKAGRE